MMKYFGLVLCALAVACRGAPVNDDQPTSSEDAVFANSLVKYNGMLNAIAPPAQCTEDKVSESVTFTLYTRETPYGQKIDPMNNNTLKNSSYNIKYNTSIVLNEWSLLEIDNGSYARDIASAYLRNKRQRVNVILVDYGTIGYCDFEHFLNLESAIGQRVGQLLKFVMKYGSTPSQLQLIGLGMGAQIAGFASRAVHPRKVGRLTALNPTFVGYSQNKPQLKSSDSDYMDVINTAQRKQGDANYLGNARFYPNAGARQPIAVPDQDDKTASLYSHYASVFYYMGSILDPSYYRAVLCKDWKHFLTNTCGESAVINFMGDGVDIKVAGDFYLKTNHPVPPFTTREIDIKYNDFRRFMDVIIKGVKRVEAAAAAVVEQAYQQKRTQAQINSDEEIANLADKFGPK